MKHLGKLVVIMFIINLFLAVGLANAHHKEKHDGGGPKHSVVTPSPDASKGGESGDRGRSPSCPDQDGTGADKGEVEDGCDKPTGETEGDGNNGCGNDADREDDNNGKCGKGKDGSTPKPTPSASPTPRPTPTEPGGGVPTASPRPTPTATGTRGPVPTPEPSGTPSVSGRTSVPDRTSEDGAIVPTTGSNALSYALAALMFIALGVTVWYTGRR